jgi:hypothetical protein
MATTSNLSTVSASSGALATALDKLRGLCTPGEELLAAAAQHRLYALTHRRIVVAATTNRLIVFRRKLFGGFTMDDLQWQDLRDGRVAEGMLASQLSISRGSDTLAVTGLVKDQAQAVYVVCQAQEQAWREKNRVRELEEMRAKSGGVQLGQAGFGLLGAASSGGGGGAVDAGEDAVARLGKAKAMLDQGLISEAEYESVKARVIEKI